MRLARMDGRWVRLIGGGVLDLDEAGLGHFAGDDNSLFENWSAVREWGLATSGPADACSVGVDAALLGAPVGAPRQIFALAVNYADHAAEAGITPPEHPLVFPKYPSSVTGPTDDIRLPSNRADWEVELVVVIGEGGHRIPREQAWQSVAGLTVGQDISERRVQARKPFPHFALAKSFPTFAPLGPVLVTPDELADPDDLAISCQINGEQVQKSRTGQLIFGVADLVAEISSVVPLLPGDLIFTGTPSGVGSSMSPRRYLSPGDTITSHIEGIGAMVNHCIDAS